MTPRLTALLLGLLLVACPSDGIEHPGGDAGAGSAGDAGGGIEDGGAGGVGDGGGLPATCVPDCVAPQTCSAAMRCIDPGTCAADEDCEAGKLCSPATSTCVPGSKCGSTQLSAQNVPPNLLLVLDRSCSMTNVVGTTTKWEIAVAAVKGLTEGFRGKIRFGLTLFPDKVVPNCEQDAIPVPVKQDRENAIQALLEASRAKTDPNYPSGPCVTNIDTAMTQAATEPAFADPARRSFVVLITDGKQAGCDTHGGNTATLKAITDLRQEDGVSTFVVGFGTGVSIPDLNSFAQAGGVPSSDPTKQFYDASDQASLDAALAAIARQTLGCLIVLGETPPDAERLFVFFDKKDLAPRDPTHKNGWDYDAAKNQISFYGATCTSLQAGTVGAVDVVFGCAEPPIN